MYNFADLEFDEIDLRTKRAQISAFICILNFWNRPTGAKTVQEFQKIVDFGGRPPPLAELTQ